MKKIVDGYFHLLKMLIALCLAVMVVLVFGNVVLRYAFNSGIPVSEELSRWLFVWLTFLGALVGMKEHGHLGVDSLVARLSPAGKKFCLVASQLLILGVLWFLFSGSLAQTQINLDVEAPASGLSMAWFYGIGLVFSVTAAGIVLHDLYRVLAGKLQDHELVMVTESEEAADLAAIQEEIAHQNRLAADHGKR
ncbi:TRAP transporter small permease [Zoogloea sp.]|uniref:TRAP transporter small permease n=1 Tax=Zoogloea sp. TaxID=49181 RepID=UPI001415FC43|nr:MAG: TRAP transporter small permease [Zoogloea sp.]